MLGLELPTEVLRNLLISFFINGLGCENEEMPMEFLLTSHEWLSVQKVCSRTWKSVEIHSGKQIRLLAKEYTYFSCWFLQQSTNQKDEDLSVLVVHWVGGCEMDLKKKKKSPQKQM